MLLHFLWNLIAFVIALGILITVHEFGHFLMACFFKVQVERFSIGFGPVLWKWRDSNNTEYVISIILFGGYVKLFNTEIYTTTTHRYNISNAFNYKNIWQKIAIILAGPVFNFIFSILLYTSVYIIGIPVYKPIIQAIIPHSIIARIGIIPGVEIKSINNVQTHNWETVRFQLLNNIGKEKITISTMSIDNTYSETYTVYLSKNWYDTSTNVRDPIIALGILPYNTQKIPVLSDVKFNSIAERSGLKIGDKILAINNQSIYDWDSLITNIKNHSENTLKISVKRRHKILHFYITLNKKDLINSNTIEEIIGIFPKIITVPLKQHSTLCKHKLHNAIFQACIKTWELIQLIINTLMKLVSGDIKTINIGGPISIAQGAGDAAHFGLIYYLMFLAIISINLGIINLLPFPTLDGGHLFFLILEKINGNPISQKIKNFGYIIGFISLILIMCFTIFNDISRLW